MRIRHSKAAQKKKKLGSQPDSHGHGDDAWVHLAKLYEALGEEDILIGVYEKHIARIGHLRTTDRASIRAPSWRASRRRPP